MDQQHKGALESAEHHLAHAIIALSNAQVTTDNFERKRKIVRMKVPVMHTLSKVRGLIRAHNQKDV